MHLSYTCKALTFLLPTNELLAEVSGDAVWIIWQIGLAINIKEHKAFLLGPQLGLNGLRVHLHVAVLILVDVHFILCLCSQK